MTKMKIDGFETASKVILANQGRALLETLARGLVTVMDSEVRERCGAEYDESSEERENSRNGFHL